MPEGERAGGEQAPGWAVGPEYGNIHDDSFEISECMNTR